MACTACGKTSQTGVPWAREGSGFTALFEALALALYQNWSACQAAALLRCTDKRLWRRIEHYVNKARAQKDMPAVTHVGIDETRRSKGLAWGMRKNPQGWTAKQAQAMHWLQRSTLKSARAWRLKMALREVYASAAQNNDPAKASADLKTWMSWARRSLLEPFKKLAKTICERFDGVVRGMLDNRSNAYVEAMNGLLQQAKRAARGFKTAANFTLSPWQGPGAVG